MRLKPGSAALFVSPPSAAPKRHAAISFGGWSRWTETLPFSPMGSPLTRSSSHLGCSRRPIASSPSMAGLDPREAPPDCRPHGFPLATGLTLTVRRPGSGNLTRTSPRAAQATSQKPPTPSGFDAMVMIDEEVL
ncbi:hypothetical protein LA080_006098 [Diaporthe eres]|nr:hypothetical protein LA080_006098 [Diaporthe eres]